MVNLEGVFQPTSLEKKTQIRFFFKSKTKRRVKRVEAVQEKIALIFVAKYYESVIRMQHIAVVHPAFKTVK